MQVTC